MGNTSKIALKIIGLLILLILLYFITMLIFLGIYGTGGQIHEKINNIGLGAILLYFLPLIVIGFISYKTFRKKKLENNITESNHVSQIVDRTNWTGENFEFLITGDIEIPEKNYDQIMTPNSFEWEKVIKDEWPFYTVGEDEFSFSWEISGIQFTFNKEVKYQKAKKIADEIIENLNSIGQKAELLTLESNKIYKF